MCETVWKSSEGDRHEALFHSLRLFARHPHRDRRRPSSMPTSSRSRRASRCPTAAPFTRGQPDGLCPRDGDAGGLALTEGPAVLTYIADLAAEGVLAPPPYTEERYQMMRWLNFVSDRSPQGGVRAADDARSSEGARDWALRWRTSAFALLSDHLDGAGLSRRRLQRRRCLSARRAQLVRACRRGDRRLAGAAAWRAKMRARPSVAQAMREEMPLRQAA